MTKKTQDKTALIIVDVQPTFMKDGGLSVTDGEAVVPIINDLIKRDFVDYVVTTQDWHFGDAGGHISENPNFKDTWPVHGMADTLEAELHPALNQNLVDIKIKKGEHCGAYSGFDGHTEDGSSLEDALNNLGIAQVFVVGLATDYCVKATALDAKKLGFDTIVLLSATRGVLKVTTDAALDEMREAGIELDFTDWVEPPETL